MKRLFFMVFVLYMLMGRAFAGLIVDEGLVLQNGVSEMLMRPGQKMYLSVRDSFWGTPHFKNVHYASENPSVAWVDKRGYIHAVLPGQTVIYASDASGSSGAVRVRVDGGGKISRTSLMVLFGLFLIVITVFASCKVCFFEPK